MAGAGPPSLSPPSTHTPQLNVLLEFADGIKAQLADMDEKLDALGDAVGAMHEDVKRLVGRPFLELYNEWRERTRGESATRLPSASAAGLAEPATEPHDTSISVGKRVEIVGLQKSHTELNGRVGVVTGFDEAKGKFRVRLGPSQVLALKPANLAVCPPPPRS